MSPAGGGDPAGGGGGDPAGGGGAAARAREWLLDRRHDVLWWVRPNGSWRWVRVGIFAIAGTIVVAGALLLMRDGVPGDSPDRRPAKGVAIIEVEASRLLTSRRYAVYATLVKGTTEQIWTRLMPVGVVYRLDDKLDKGPYVLSFTVTPCPKRDCSTFRGGSSIGVVKLRRGKDVTVRVRVACAAVKRAGTSPDFDCSGSTLGVA